MGREYELEYLLRRVLNCDRPQQLLSFGGIAHAGCLEYEGDFYIGVIAVLSSIYSRATIDQCRQIDNIIDDINVYKDIRINEIPEEQYTEIYRRIETISNLTIINN